VPLDSHNVGDDLAGFFDDDHVPLADVFAPDLVRIVQTGSADGGSGQLDRFEFRRRCDHPDLPTLTMIRSSRVLASYFSHL
jgi:hypothetical protein